MNPSFNNGFPATPTTSPTLTQDDDILEGATGFDPYNCYSGTPSRVPEPYSAFQDTTQLFPGGQEKLDDVSTWDMKTIRDVATSMAQNPALFDLQDQWVPTLQDTTDPCRVWNYEDGDDDDDEEDAWGANGGMDNNHAPFCAAPGSSVVPVPSEGAAPRRRKLKMYEWPPQADPVLEKKRIRALRQRQQRMKDEELEMNLRRELKARKSEVADLTVEVQRRQQILLELQRRVAQQGYNSLPHGGY